MYSLAVGACPSAAIFSVSFLNSQIRFNNLGRTTSAIQYVFRAAITPATSASGP